MPNKNVKDFPTISTVDITTSNSLLSVVNGELRRLSAGNLSLLSLSGVTGIFSNGSTPALPLINNPLTVVGSGNSYIQLNIQNRASGTNATADLVITANNGTDSANFINLGINNSGYNDPTFSNGSGLDGYLFINGGSLDIGTATPNTQIEFHVGGTTANRSVARIDSSGINLTTGTYRINNVPANSFTITFTHSPWGSANGTNVYFNNLNAAGFTPNTNPDRRKIKIMQNCQARFASWQTVTTANAPSLPATGFIYNLTTARSGIISTNIINNTSNIIDVYSGAINPPIDFRFGDEASIGWNVPNQAISPTNSINVVDVYFFG